MKSGFVTLIGRSNVGKSTLLNALVGSKVAIVTPKPQTTRRPVRGILHDERGQIVFVDTPGMFLGKKDILTKTLNEFAKQQLHGIDLVVYVTDPARPIGEEEEGIQRTLRALQVPIIMVINKSDLPKLEKRALVELKQTDIGQKATLEISALKRKDLNKLVDMMFNELNEGEPFYPEMQITDMSHKEWLEELIREKAFLRLHQELPYSVAVTVDEIEEREKEQTYVRATIWTTHDRYKRMIIGAGGSKLKEIGTDTRKELEAVSGKRVFLELRVKTDPKWPQRIYRTG
jgi:GTP-binding protein Era